MLEFLARTGRTGRTGRTRTNKTTVHATSKHETSKHETSKHETSEHETSKHETSEHETSKHVLGAEASPRGPLLFVSFVESVESVLKSIGSSLRISRYSGDEIQSQNRWTYSGGEPVTRKPQRSAPSRLTRLDTVLTSHPC